MDWWNVSQPRNILCLQFEVLISKAGFRMTRDLKSEVVDGDLTDSIDKVGFLSHRKIQC